MAELMRRGYSGPEVAHRLGISRSMAYKWANYDIKRLHSNNVRLLCDIFPIKAEFTADGKVNFSFTESHRLINTIEKKVLEPIDKYRQDNEEHQLMETWMDSQEKIKLIKAIVQTLLSYPAAKLKVLNEFLKQN